MSTQQTERLAPADPGYQHTVLYRRQSETRCGQGAPDRRGSTPPQILLLPKCPGCYPLQQGGAR